MDFFRSLSLVHGRLPAIAIAQAKQAGKPLPQIHPVPVGAAFQASTASSGL